MQIERQPVPEQCTDLANFVENLMDVSKSGFGLEMQQEGQSFSVSSFNYLFHHSCTVLRKTETF